MSADKQSLVMEAPKAAPKDDKEVTKTKKGKKATETPLEEPSVQAYIGAELYSQRMFPYGCPSFQKAYVKLYKVQEFSKGSKKKQLKLIDSQYFTNHDGFGFMLRNLTKGNYQMEVKKYSFGFDVFDFTARIYSEKNIKLIDVEQEEILKAKEKQEKKKAQVGGSRTITESSNPTSKETTIKPHFSKAGDQNSNEKRMIDIDPHT